MGVVKLEIPRRQGGGGDALPEKADVSRAQDAGMLLGTEKWPIVKSILVLDRSDR